MWENEASAEVTIYLVTVTIEQAMETRRNGLMALQKGDTTLIYTEN